jgi:Na+-driven multidrug efflux pump
MRLRSWQTVLSIVLVLAVVLLLAVPADAQCSMCRAVLNGSNNGKFIRYLNIGVLVLLLPPVSIFVTIFILLRKYRATD